MSAINYSKWDTLDAGSDDEGGGQQLAGGDDEYDGDDFAGGPSIQQPPSRQPPAAALPRGLTRLEHPSRVVIGPNGPTVERVPQALVSPFRNTGNVDGATGPPTASDSEQRLYASLTRNGLELTSGTHMWGQSRTAVTLCLVVPPHTKAKDVCAVTVGGADDKDLAFKLFGSQVAHQLRYPVVATEEALTGCWQLQSLPSRGLRLLVINLEKNKFGIAGTLWWERALAADVEVIDTLRVVDRGGGDSKEHDAQQAKTAWDEAHEKFKLNMANRKQQPPSTSPGEA